jgi:hypothetical protein
MAGGGRQVVSVLLLSLTWLSDDPGCCHYVVPLPLDFFGGGIGWVLWQVEEDRLSVCLFFPWLNPQMIQGSAMEIGLGIVHQLLDEKGQCGKLVHTFEEVVQE